MKVSYNFFREKKTDNNVWPCYKSILILISLIHFTRKIQLVLLSNYLYEIHYLPGEHCFTPVNFFILQRSPTMSAYELILWKPWYAHIIIWLTQKSSAWKNTFRVHSSQNKISNHGALHISSATLSNMAFGVSFLPDTANKMI